MVTAAASVGTAIVLLVTADDIVASLEAQTSLEALDIAQKHSGAIDVLLTDIVMPGLRGNELAQRVVQCHPEVQVIYMSGYAEGLQESNLPENAVFLQKPFRFATLLEQLKLVRRRP
jgi:two-component system cell cycle sensor histidine kinase/response regulator CckA